MNPVFYQKTTAEIQQIALLWYHFRQNNSGGYFIKNEIVCEEVFIQERSAKEAMKKAYEIFEGHSEYCSCCGERWDVEIDEQDGNVVPMIYDERIEDMGAGTFREEARLHFFDGRIEKYKFGTEQVCLIKTLQTVKDNE